MRRATVALTAPVVLVRRAAPRPTPGKILALMMLAVLAAQTDARAGPPEPPRVAFFGFHLINSSLEQVSAIEEERIRNLDSQLRESLEGSSRFAFADLTPAIRSAIAAGPWVGNCNGCEIAFSKSLRADLAAWGTVQKVSNLILNINVYIEDVRTGAMIFVHSVDIRGNTDVSWRRGLGYLLRNYLLTAPPGAWQSPAPD